MPDHYTYPDADHLRTVEVTITIARVIYSQTHPIPGSFDLAHLQAIHSFIMSPLYEWAGQIRDTVTGPVGTGLAHYRPEFILSQSHIVFGQLADWNQLRDLDHDRFAERLASVWGEVSAGAVSDGRRRPPAAGRRAASHPLNNATRGIVRPAVRAHMRDLRQG